MARNDLGQVYRRTGRLAKATELFCRATDILDLQRKKLGGTIEGRIAFGRTTTDLYSDCLASLIDSGQPEKAFQSLERGRARSFLDLLVERDLAWTADLPPDLALARQQADADYDRAQDALAHLSPVRDPAEVNRRLVQLRELRARQAEIVEKIRQASPRAAALQYPQPLDLAAPGTRSIPGAFSSPGPSARSDLFCSWSNRWGPTRASRSSPSR